MLNMKEIVDYGPCYVLAINCPADGIDLPHKTTLFDVFDSATHETIDTFRTASSRHFAFLIQRIKGFLFHSSSPFPKVFTYPKAPPDRKKARVATSSIFPSSMCF